MTQIEPHIPWYNSDKKGVGILKRGGERLMRNMDTPSVLWEWALDYEPGLRFLQ